MGTWKWTLKDWAEMSKQKVSARGHSGKRGCHGQTHGVRKSMECHEMRGNLGWRYQVVWENDNGELE